MKNLHQKFLAGGLFLLQFFAVSMASAASSPASFMPQNPQFYFQLDTTKDHPLKGQLNDLITKLTSETPDSIPQKLITAAIDNTVIGFSQTANLSDQSEIYLMAFSLDENTFNQIISAASSTELKTTDLGMNRKIYTAQDDFFFTYKLGNVVASNQKGLISDLLMSDSSAKLSANTDYQNLLSRLNTSGFLMGFLDYEKLYSKDFSNLPSSLESVKIEGFSASQLSQGLSGQVYLKFKPDSPFKPEQFQFTPDLYQKVSAKNLLYYQEYFNFSNQFKLATDGVSADSEFQNVFSSISAELSSSLGLNVSTDLAPLFQGKSAIAIHSDLDNQYYPAFSLISDVRGKETQGKTVLDKVQAAISEAVKTSLRSEYDNQVEMRDYYTQYYPDETNPYKDLPAYDVWEKQAIQTQTVQVNGSTLTQIILDPTAGSTSWSEAGDRTKYKFSLAFGITNDGNLIFTTLRNPASLFDYAGLNADQNFRNNFSAQQLTGLSYLNFTNLRSYLNTMLTTLQAGNEISTSVDNFLTPFQSLTAVTTADSGALLSTIKLNADLTKLSGFGDLISSMMQEFSSFSKNSDFQLPEPQKIFPDVAPKDWFYGYVSGVHNDEIMNGYTDGMFRPNQPITRAEFVKTLMEALKWRGEDLSQPLNPVMENATAFDDYDSNAWYAEAVKSAQLSGLVKGFADHTFHPNQPITRAEAVQILYNASSLLKSTESLDFSQNQFNDVRPSDWFYTAVSSAHYYGVVNGKTDLEFKPNDLLTRAETAKIIEQFLYL
jgi:hypothetical protein